MREAADVALAEFGIHHASLRLITHDFNTTFRVDADGRRYALRLAMNSDRSAEEVTAEMEWMSAIAAETDLVVPTPRPTTDGELVAQVPVTGLGGAQPAVLCRWLDGRTVGDGITKRQARELGRLAAAVDQHGAGWKPTSAAVLRRLNTTLMDAADRLGATADVGGPEALATLRESQAVIDDILQPVFGGALQPIHADLHPSNVKWHVGKMSVFDFNDFGLGTTSQELAIAASYLRDQPFHEAELIAGYGEIGGDLDVTNVQFEALLAARSLLLCSDFVGSVTGSDPRTVADYVALTVARQRHFLDTAAFSLNPPHYQRTM